MGYFCASDVRVHPPHQAGREDGLQPGMGGSVCKEEGREGYAYLGSHFLCLLPLEQLEYVDLQFEKMLTIAANLLTKEIRDDIENDITRRRR